MAKAKKRSIASVKVENKKEAERIARGIHRIEQRKDNRGMVVSKEHDKKQRNQEWASFWNSTGRKTTAVYC